MFQYIPEQQIHMCAHVYVGSELINISYAVVFDFIWQHFCFSANRQFEQCAVILLFSFTIASVKLITSALFYYMYLEGAAFSETFCIFYIYHVCTKIWHNIGTAFQHYGLYMSGLINYQMSRTMKVDLTHRHDWWLCWVLIFALFADEWLLVKWKPFRHSL